jgi:hypothetical protein
LIGGELVNLNTVKSSFEAEGFGAEGFVDTNLSESTDELFDKEEVYSTVEGTEATLLRPEL